MATSPNRYPLYVVSKGRWESRLTVKALDRMGCDYKVVVERQEYDQYAAYIAESKLLILDPAYQSDYETLDNLGDQKSKGPGPARNFAWQHSIDSGHSWHWVMDDNIRHFIRLNKNRKTRVYSPAFFSILEDFVLRYANVLMAGPNYEKFVPRRRSKNPITINTRIYSCNLIRNDTPFRWRGRYNEDTDLSLMILKSGACTIQFNAYLQEKVTTQKVKGGNTAEFYATEGTLHKSRMLVNTHPDVSRLVYRHNRWHHHVDYTRFAGNKLIKREDAVIPDEPNEYGLVRKRLRD